MDRKQFVLDEELFTKLATARTAGTSWTYFKCPKRTLRIPPWSPWLMRTAGLYRS